MYVHFEASIDSTQNSSALVPYVQLNQIDLLFESQRRCDINILNRIIIQINVSRN